MKMQIETIEIRNYRLFRETVFDSLQSMVVVVGANGSGKSTLFDVFSFLKEALTDNVAVAVARRGGYRELVSRGESGAIGITVKFRESGGRLATYQLEIANVRGRPVVDREVLKFRRGQYGKPWHFVDFRRGRGTAITNEAVYGQEGVEAERDERVLDDPSVLAIKGLGLFKEFRVVSEFRSLIENWHVSDFHISDARPSAEAGYAEHLSLRGDNDPKPFPLLAVEGPENQLYPELLHELVEEFRDYARRGGQVFVSTHSPDFLNAVRLEETLWLVKQDGFTSVKRASDSELLRRLVDAGDLPGALWKQGLLEGAGLRCGHG